MQLYSRRERKNRPSFEICENIEIAAVGFWFSWPRPAMYVILVYSSCVYIVSGQILPENHLTVVNLLAF